MLDVRFLSIILPIVQWQTIIVARECNRSGVTFTSCKQFVVAACHFVKWQLYFKVPCGVGWVDTSPSVSYSISSHEDQSATGLLIFI